MFCVYYRLDVIKKGDNGTAFESDKGGGLNHYGNVFPVTRQGPAHSASFMMID